MVSSTTLEACPDIVAAPEKAPDADEVYSGGSVRPCGRGEEPWLLRVELPE